MFFCTPKIIIADESALKSMFDVKGASGMVPCIHCANILAKRNPLDSEHVLTICSTDVPSFKVKSDEALFKAAEHLVTQKDVLPIGRLEDLEKSLGLHANARGLLARRSMGRSSCMFDWMHVYIVHGIFHMELNVLIPQLAKIRISSDKLQELISEFVFPQADGWMKKEVLASFAGGGDFKAPASTCLSLYPVLRIIFQRGSDIVDTLRNEMKSFSALCAVLDYLVAGNRGQTLQASKLQTLIMEHCNLFLKAYGEEPVIHKFHMAMHLPMSLRQFGHEISCFTHERKHTHVKRIADNLQTSQSGFEKSVATDIWHSMLQDMSCLSGVPEPQLVGPKCAGPQLQAEVAKVFGFNHALCSSKCQCRPGQTVTEGDMAILHGNEVAEIWLHCKLPNGQIWTLLSVWKPLGRNVFKRVNAPNFVQTARLERAAVHKFLDNDRCVVVP